MATSNGQPCVSICCENGSRVNDPGARCYWNISLSSEVAPKIYNPEWVTMVKPNDLLPNDITPCPKDTVCYSDCMSGNNISTYLFGNGLTTMNASIDGGLTCRLDAVDHCFKSYATKGTENIMSACETFFNLIENMKFANIYAHQIQTFYLSVMSISLPFLLAMFVIYTIIPDLKNLHGSLLRSYIACCFTYFLTMVIFTSNPSLSCNFFMLILFHFAFLTIYSWLNAMCFDIWWTFRSLNKCSNQSTRKKYIFYSIYAWGIPLLLIGINLILNFDPTFLENPTEPPRRCWLQDQQMRLVYLNLPATIMVAFNLCFFILTIINIIRQKKATAQYLDGSYSLQYDEEKKRLYFHLKLVFVIGISIVAEILPVVIQSQIPRYIPFALILPFMTHGLIIFVLFIWNNENRRLLTEHLGLKDWVAKICVR